MKKDWSYEQLRELRHEIEAGPAEPGSEVATNYILKLLEAVLDMNSELQELRARVAAK